MTRLDALYHDFGQSPWIDNIRRDWLNDGTLAALVAEGVRGVTSNPSIFAKALTTSSAYDQFLDRSDDLNPETLFEAIAVADVRDACDVLAPVYGASLDDFCKGRRRYRDGFVSLEVSPLLARDTEGTIAAARRLAAAVGRDNVMIKIPATREGLPAVTAVLAEGINVNVTLIFSVERYAEVLEAWLTGLERARTNDRSLAGIASVASFFVSRVDTAVDRMLASDDPRRGHTANAQVARAYQLYRERIGSDRAANMLEAGAQVQRPLWASTSVKNPAYPDLLYVDVIAADETVNTMPDATLQAALDHGNFATSVLRDDDSAARAAEMLEGLAPTVDLDRVTSTLEIDGVKAFVDSYREILDTVAAKIQSSS